MTCAHDPVYFTEKKNLRTSLPTSKCFRQFMFSNTSSNNSNNGWNKSTGFAGIAGANNTSGSSSLFGNSGASAAAGSSLFGNSATQNKPLFGLTNATNNTSFNGNSSGSGLFLNNSSQPTSTANNGGLFGQSNANPTSQNTVTQPYVNNSIFQGVPTNYEMPASITGDFFSESKGPNKLLEAKTHVRNNSNKASIFSKIASRFNIFKTVSGFEEPESSSGVFASSEFPSSRPLLSSKAKSSINKITKPTAFNLIEARSSNETKKLIIRSKPLKFHLINADKVLNSRRKRVITSLILSEQLLNDEGDEDSDHEASNVSFSNETYAKRVKLLKNVSQGPSTSTVFGTSVEADSRGDGYWTSPSISELKSWSLKDLSSIENFIIGRKGFGQIAFNESVDLSDMKRTCNELDYKLEDELFFKTVEIGLKYVKVYKDDDNKPSRGFGMNVPATITLENINPTTGKDLNTFINMLKSKEGMEFVTYDPIMFLWVFKVQHFSVWGLVDEDNENLTSLSSDDYNRELKKQKLNNATRNVPGNWSSTSNSNILNFKKRLVNHEINSQIDFYRDSPTNALLTNLKAINDDILDEISNVEEEVFPTRENYEYLKQLINVLPTNVDLLEIVQEKAYEPTIDDESAFDAIQPRPNVAVSGDWLVQLELTNDVNSSLAQYLSNPTLRIEEYGKLKMELVDNLLFSNVNEAAESSKEVSTPLLDTEDGKKSDILDDVENKDELVKDFKQVIKLALNKSTFTQRSNMFPKAQINSSGFHEFLSDQISTKLVDILKLASALFDKIDEETDEMIEDSSMIEKLNVTKRKAKFMEWLKSFNLSLIEELLSKAKDEFQKTLIFLCAGDIKNAVKTAMESKNMHLSSILTLSDSGFDGIAKVARSQLQEWNNNDYIPENLMKIYDFLAGNRDKVLTEFPWQLKLSCKVYFESTERTLGSIIDDVTADIDEDNYTIEILKFYSKFSSATVTTSLGNLQSPDFNTFHKWIVLAILGEGLDDNITLKVGKLTDALGLWKESLYIYSHLMNDQIAKKSIEKVVNQNIKYIKNEKNNVDEEQYLVSTLKVPTKLIYESVATEMNTAKDYWKACEAFITARSWTNAHDCITQSLGPQIVVSKDILDIRRLQRILSAFPDGGNIISTWSEGAGIFQKYFRLLPYIKEAKLPSELDAVSSLLDNVPLLKLDDSLTSIAAIQIICKDVGDLAIASKSPDLKERILGLPLDEDERIYFTSQL